MQSPATKKRRTNDGVEEMEPAAAVEQMEIAVELSTDYFRQILDNEINVLEQHCILWDAEKNQELPEEIEEQILLAVGMARLLIREKFNQFRGLIQNCDEPEDIKTKTLLSDLQGFWDMIKIQADNIAAMFGALEKLKANNWKEQKPEVKSKVALKRKAGAPKAAKPAAASRFKAFLAQKKGGINKFILIEKNMHEVRTHRRTEICNCISVEN
jgi:Guanylate-kinase-associated protein (GKAP) protein